MKSLFIATILHICFEAALFAQSSSKMGVGPVFKNKHEGKRKALVLANQNYKFQPPLKNTLLDADSMDVALRFLGFEVMLVKDKELPEIKDAIDRFKDALTSGDVAFIYYSGHGLGYQRDNYLLPIEFPIGTTEGIRNRAISTTELRDGISRKGVRNLFLVVDACRNELTAKGDGAYKLVAPEDNPPGTLIAFATDYGQTATYLSTQNKNSLYTESLLIYLQQPLEVQEIFRRANQRTYSESKKLGQPTQYPHYIPMIYDDYYFLKIDSSNHSSKPTHKQPKAPVYDPPFPLPLESIAVVAYKPNSTILDYGLAKLVVQELKLKFPNYDIQPQTNSKGAQNNGFVCTVTRTTSSGKNPVQVNNETYDLVKADTELKLTFKEGKTVRDEVELSGGGTDHQKEAAVQNSIDVAIAKLKDTHINLPTPNPKKR